MTTCPHCGNADDDKVQDNNLDAHDPEYTLLCVAPCERGQESYDCDDGHPLAGLCGYQWCPNDIR